MDFFTGFGMAFAAFFAVLFLFTVVGLIVEQVVRLCKAKSAPAKAPNTIWDCDFEPYRATGVRNDA